MNDEARVKPGIDPMLPVGIDAETGAIVPPFSFDERSAAGLQTNDRYWRIADSTSRDQLERESGNEVTSDAFGGRVDLLDAGFRNGRGYRP